MNIQQIQEIQSLRTHINNAYIAIYKLAPNDLPLEVFELLRELRTFRDILSTYPDTSNFNNGGTWPIIKE